MVESGLSVSFFKLLLIIEFSLRFDYYRYIGVTGWDACQPYHLLWTVSTRATRYHATETTNINSNTYNILWKTDELYSSCLQWNELICKSRHMLIICTIYWFDYMVRMLKMFQSLVTKMFRWHCYVIIILAKEQK